MSKPPTRAELRRHQFESADLAELCFRYLVPIARKQRREGNPIPIFFEHEANSVLTIIQDFIQTSNPWSGKVEKMKAFVEREYREHPETAWNRRVEDREREDQTVS